MDLTGLQKGMMVVAAAEQIEEGDAISVAKLLEINKNQGRVKWFTRKQQTRKFYDLGKNSDWIELDTLVHYDFKLNQDYSMPRKVLKKVTEKMGKDEDDIFGA